MKSDANETLKLLAEAVVKNVVEKYKLNQPDAQRRVMSEKEKAALKAVVEKIQLDVKELLKKDE